MSCTAGACGCVWVVLCLSISLSLWVCVCVLSLKAGCGRHSFVSPCRTLSILPAHHLRTYPNTRLAGGDAVAESAWDVVPAALLVLEANASVTQTFTVELNDTLGGSRLNCGPGLLKPRALCSIFFFLLFAQSVFCVYLCVASLVSSACRSLHLPSSAFTTTTTTLLVVCLTAQALCLLTGSCVARSSARRCSTSLARLHALCPRLWPLHSATSRLARVPTPVGTPTTAATQCTPQIHTLGTLSMLLSIFWHVPCMFSEAP
jgi:hypothetical protein